MDENESTRIQFDLIRQIDTILCTAKIHYWLRGGWAIDFILGRMTRFHSDIDLVAWKHDAIQIRYLLEDAGFLFERDTGVQIDLSKLGQEISIVFIVQNGEKVGVANIPEWIWLPDALTFPPQQIDELVCPVISPRQLLEEKAGYQRGTGIPPRDKDLQSIKVLEHYLRN